MRLHFHTFYYYFFSDSTTTDRNQSDNVGLKVLITFLALAAALISAAIIAKLVNMFFDKRATSDDASDISDNTRDLIRARLALIQIQKRRMSKPKGPNIRGILRRWYENVKIRKKTRDEVLNSKRPVGDTKIVVEPGIELNENTATARSARSPIFEGGSSPVTKAKLQIHSSTTNGRKPGSLQHTTAVINNSASLQHAPVVVSNSVVTKGRPVSSKPHILTQPSPLHMPAAEKTQIFIETESRDNSSTKPPEISS